MSGARSSPTASAAHSQNHARCCQSRAPPAARPMRQVRCIPVSAVDRGAHADRPVELWGLIDQSQQRSQDLVPDAVGAEPAIPFHTVCQGPNAAGRPRQAIPQRQRFEDFPRRLDGDPAAADPGRHQAATWGPSAPAEAATTRALGDMSHRGGPRRVTRGRVSAMTSPTRTWPDSYAGPTDLRSVSSPRRLPEPLDLIRHNR